jgi:hypothetical protein
MSASGVDDWEEPPAELEPPEAGWPWQLALCRVFECQQTGYSRSFKIQCTKCGWAPAGFTQAARVQTHFGRVLAGGKPGGANKCGVSKDILLEQEPEFMGKIASALDTSIKRKQTANESRDSVKKKLKAADSASTESGLLPVGWAMKLPAAKREILAEAHKMVSLYFFVHNVPFHHIDTDEFHNMVQAIKACPTYLPACRATLAGPQMLARDAEATQETEITLADSLEFGLVLTGDGYRSKHKKRQYHNHQLLTVSGPVFLGMADTTGEPGTAQDIFEEFEEVMESLEPEVKIRIMLGVLDTPSPNVAAWTLLMEKFTRQIWQGCMAHEIALCMKDIAKLQVTIDMKLACKSLVIWINNHPAVFKIFAAKVHQHFLALKNQAETAEDKASYSSKMEMRLYMPGDTRMLTVFKMFFRIVVLRDVLVALFTDTEYQLVAQKAMKGYNSRTGVPEIKKYKKKIGGINLIDPNAESFGGIDKPIWASLERWCQTNVSLVYLHRMCDTHKPFMHYVYYGCCLVDKQLRMLAAIDEVGGFVKQVQSIFLKRWYRWHTCLHTLCYHANPCYQAHEISTEEWEDCDEACARLFGEDSADIRLGLQSFKRSRCRWNDSEWKKADVTQGHTWWLTFGNKMKCTDGSFSVKVFVDAMKRLCSLCGSASSTEQGVSGWSKVGAIETAQRSRLQTSKTNKLVNIGGAAWARKQISYNKTVDVVRDLSETLAEMVDETQGKVVGPESADDLQSGGLPNIELGAAPGEGGGEAGNEATSESEDEFEEFAEFASDFSGPRTQGVFTCRKELRCNKSLESALPRIINFRESDLACRRLAFD